MIFEKLFKSNIYNLKPYKSARDEYSGQEGIFLDANENPYGSVIEFQSNRYPDPLQREAKALLAKLKKVNENQIFFGNGSDEAIDLLIKTICRANEDQIMVFPPTYGMYKVLADIYEVEAVEVPLTEELQLDLEAINKAYKPSIKIAWVCSPNNPTGGLINRNDILELLKTYPELLVVVDEAYIDFCDEPSFTTLLNEFENLVIIQTFSKAWGMAGMRIGMAYANQEVIKIFNKVKFPYNISLASQNAIIEALQPQSIVKKDKFIADILVEREFLKEALLKLENVKGILPSDSNQLLVQFKDSEVVFKNLLERKIIIRDRSSLIRCKEGLRITIGTRQENQALLKVLQ